MTRPAIETHDLRKVYGSTVALAGLDLVVGPGEVFGFLGPNGAGKTTAVKLLLGLTSPSAGDGRVLGMPLGDRTARRRIGYLPELFRYQAWLSAREVLDAPRGAGRACRGVGVVWRSTGSSTSSASRAARATGPAGSRRACSSAWVSRRP